MSSRQQLFNFVQLIVLKLQIEYINLKPVLAACREVTSELFIHRFFLVRLLYFLSVCYHVIGV